MVPNDPLIDPEELLSLSLTNKSDKVYPNIKWNLNRWNCCSMSAAVPGSESAAPDPGTQVRLRVASLNSVHTATSGGGGGKRGVLGGRGLNNKPYCCFCWCCCCSCTCLAVKGGSQDSSKLKDSNNQDILNCDGEPTPSLEEIRCWGKSFDRLMKSSAGRKLFREFLRCEYSEENILFWLACEDLKKESNPDVIEEKARFIYEDYISILSPKEVSLDSRVREIVNRNMVSPSNHTFDEAQLQIYTLMHRDSYPRFINSAVYKQLAQLDASPVEGGGNSDTCSTPARKSSNAT
uniref:Regulator of G-protein signaling 20 n=1 Tax=Cacopsylla melanoneura TaxID=428564 RepID=A0A8D9A4E7_9HEMI